MKECCFYGLPIDPGKFEFIYQEKNIFGFIVNFYPYIFFVLSLLRAEWTEVSRTRL